MEEAVYKILMDMQTLVNNEKGILSSTDIAYLRATVKTLLTVYAPADVKIPGNDPGEARRPPARPTKKSWYERIFG